MIIFGHPEPYFARGSEEPFDYDSREEASLNKKELAELAILAGGAASQKLLTPSCNFFLDNITIGNIMKA